MRSRRMLGRFADKTHGTVTQHELRPAGMQAMEPLPLRLIARIDGHVHGPLRRPLERQDVRTVRRAVARMPASIPIPIPVASGGLLWRISFAKRDLAHHD